MQAVACQPQNQFVASSRHLGALIAVCLALAGCGSSGPERVPVSGRITYGGGDWPVEGMLYFNPLDSAEGSPRSHGIARFDRHGNYVVQNLANHAQGLFPGTYRINIECWKVPPTMEGGAPSSYVSTSYLRDDRHLTLDVKTGSPLIYSFDVPKQ